MAIVTAREPIATMTAVPEGDHYFSAEPSVAERIRTVRFRAAGRDFALTSSSGVFSGDRLDAGTAVLLRKAPLPREPGRYLDLGCGYGPISAVLAAVSGGEVTAVDVNARALELTERNTAGLPGTVRVRRPDEVPADARFDQIWSNPPVRIGKPALHELLADWLPRLAADGVAWLVIARHLGGDSLAVWLTQQGYRVDKHASQKGYRVLRVAAGM